MPDDRMIADFIGIADKPPQASRRGFMTASAAMAAGYTVLAGPVRAQVVTTDTTKRTVGRFRCTAT